MVNCDVGAPGPRGRAAGRRSVTVVAPSLSLSLRWKSYSHTDKVWCNNEEQSHCQEAFWKLGYSVSKCQCLYSGLEFSKWYKVTNMICSVYVNTFSGGLILIWWHHFRISFLFFGYRPRLRLMQKNIFQTNVFFYPRQLLFPTISDNLSQCLMMMVFKQCVLGIFKAWTKIDHLWVSKSQVVVAHHDWTTTSDGSTVLCRPLKKSGKQQVFMWSNCTT